MREHKRHRPRNRFLHHKYPRRHDMFEQTDFDFPDDFDVEDWMISYPDAVQTS